MNKKKPKKLKVIDLFAGCGGLSDGFHQSGLYDFIAHVEWEKAECNTIRKRLTDNWNYKDSQNRVVCFDIQRSKELFSGWKNDNQFGSHQGLNKILKNCNSIDLIIGGPPCQAYSLAGRIRDEYGMQFDYRNYLFESYVEVVKRIKPKAFLFENVPGILSAKPGGISVISRIKKAFRKIGYEITDQIRENALLDLTEFGIPQKRKRVILVGLKINIFKSMTQDLIFQFYSELNHISKLSKPLTVSDAIADLDPFYPSKNIYIENGSRFSHFPSHNGIPNHKPRYHSGRDIEIFRLLADDIYKKRFKYIDIDALKELYTKKTGKKSNVHKYYVLRWDEPSNTIPAHLYKDGLRHIHPDPKQARTITPREAARIQTFDDDFVFMGSQTDQYRMIGNAVPPQFSKILGHCIFDILNT